jgi:hypothetical protein
VNDTEIVVTEVKTTLRPPHIERFLGILKDFKEIFPIYKEKKVFGAMAYLREESEAATRARRKGLFTVKATGNSASITNTEGFVPDAY